MRQRQGGADDARRHQEEQLRQGAVPVRGVRDGCEPCGAATLQHEPGLPGEAERLSGRRQERVQWQGAGAQSSEREQPVAETPEGSQLSVSDAEPSAGHFQSQRLRLHHFFLFFLFSGWILFCFPPLISLL